MVLDGKVVIVSGIGPGLGQELSTLAAKEGAAAVVMAARTPAKLDTAEAEIRELLSQFQGLVEGELKAIVRKSRRTPAPRNGTD